MSRLVGRFVAATVIIVSLFIRTATAFSFGHLAVVPSVPDSSKEAFEVRVDSESPHPLSSEPVLIWNLTPGRHLVTVTSAEVQIEDTVLIVPYLTTRLRMEFTHDHWSLTSDGFADQSGPLMLFNRAELSRLPGELSDGVGLFTTHLYDSTRYSYRGGSLWGEGWEFNRSLSGITAPEFALANLGDPFAGEESEDIYFSHDYFSAGYRAQGVYGQFDQRFGRGSAVVPMPLLEGTLFGSATYENHLDAAPKANWSGRLPFNDAENLELIGGAMVQLPKQFALEVQGLFKRDQRRMYLQPFYFNRSHTPRLEDKLYRVGATLYGKVRPQIFAAIGFGLFSEESVEGDGELYDNRSAYVRPFSDPGFNEALFYEPDNPATAYNDASLFRGLLRDRRAGTEFEGYVTYEHGEGSLRWASIRYSRTELRRYHNYRPDRPDAPFLIDRFGFETDGITANDRNGPVSAPTPEQVRFSLGERIVRRGWFLALAMDGLLYDPNDSQLRSLQYPLGDPSGPNNSVLDSQDLLDVGLRLSTGARFAAGICLSPDWTISFAGANSHQYPALAYRHTGWEFIENRIAAGLDDRPFGNAAGYPVTTITRQLVIRYDTESSRWHLALSQVTSDNLVAARRINGSPNSYLTYDRHEQAYSDETSYAVTLTGRQAFGRALNTFFLARLETGEPIQLGPSATLQYWDQGVPYPYSEQPLLYLDDYNRATVIKTVLYAGLNMEHLHRPNTVVGELLGRVRIDATMLYRTGVPYVRADTFFAGGLNQFPLYPRFLVGKRVQFASDLLEVNVGLEARLVQTPGVKASIRAEALNLLNVRNLLQVHEATGLGDDDGFLLTEDGQEFVYYTSTPDYTGLNGEQKYRLYLNDPNNFSRPRMIRVLLQGYF